MSHSGMTGTQAQAYFQMLEENSELGSLELPAFGGMDADMIRKVQFGVETIEGVEYREFPKYIAVMESIDFISYEAVLKCLTEEESFFQLQATDEITADGQRCIKRIDDPFVDDRDVMSISVSIPGILSPDTLLALLQGATNAGHHLMTPVRRGSGATEYTIFTLIPNYVEVPDVKE